MKNVPRHPLISSFSKRSIVPSSRGPLDQANQLEPTGPPFIITQLNNWYSFYHPIESWIDLDSWLYTKIYVKKLFSLYRLQCKGDIVVADIKQHKSQFKNSNFTITVSKVLLTLCNGDVRIIKLWFVLFYIYNHDVTLTLYIAEQFFTWIFAVLLPLEVIKSWIKSGSRITTTTATTTTATPISTSTISNPYFTITILYPYHNLPYPHCYHNPMPTLPLSYRYLYYYYYYCDRSHIFYKPQ